MVWHVNKVSYLPTFTYLEDNQLGSDDTDYFGDVDTSSCESSEPAGSDSEGNFSVK